MLLPPLLLLRLLLTLPTLPLVLPPTPPTLLVLLLMPPTLLPPPLLLRLPHLLLTLPLLRPLLTLPLRLQKPTNRRFFSCTKEASGLLFYAPFFGLTGHRTAVQGTQLVTIRVAHIRQIQRPQR